MTTTTNPTRSFQGSSQWDLVPLGPTLISNPNQRKIFCDVYKSVTPTKGKSFCYVYKSKTPTKGKIFYDVYKSRTPTKGKSSAVFINIKNHQKEQYSVMFINKLPTIHQKLSNLRNCLEDNQCIDCDRCNNKKTEPLSRTSTSLWGKQIRMSGLEYSLLTIFYHTRGQVSGSMYTDPINMVHTSQKPEK